MIVSKENCDCEKVDKSPDSFIDNKPQVKEKASDGHGSIKDNLREISSSKIKGFHRDQSKKIICLDCGKYFKHKNSYNCHKRM